MLKKRFAIAFILALIGISVPVFAYDLTYELIARDDFNYTLADMTTGTQIAMADYDFKGEVVGEGFTYNWSTSTTRYTPPTATGFVYQVILGKVTISNYNPIPIWKGLAKPLDLSRDGQYYVSVAVFAASTNDANKLAGDYRFMVGGTNLFMGYKYDANDLTKLVPQLGVGGTVTMGNSRYNAYEFSDYAFYIYKMKIDNNANGEDTISMKMYREGAAEPNEWDISLTTELGNGTLDYIGFSPSQAGFHSQRTRSILIEYQNQTLLDELDGIIEKLNTAAALEEDVARAFEILGTHQDGRAKKSSYIAMLRDYSIANSMSEAYAPKGSFTKPDIDEVIASFKTNQVEVAFNYILDGESEFSFESNAGAVDASYTINKNLLTITLNERLAPDTVYTVRPISAKDYKGDSITDDLSFTTGISPMINLYEGQSCSQGYVLRWVDGRDILTSCVIENEEGKESAIENDYHLDEPGNYVLKLTSVRDSIQESYKINFSVVEDIAPTATDVRIEGEATTFAELKGLYTYYDANGDQESGTVLKWYRIREGVAQYEHVGSEATYTLGVEDENCKFIFEVTPKSNSAMNPVGKSVSSAVFTGAYKPAVSDVMVLSPIAAGSYATVTYKYKDINGDEESGTEIYWYYVDPENDELVDITGNAEGAQLYIGEYLYEKYILAAVKPANEKEPRYGDITYSERVIGPSAPVVSNVHIEGSGKIGSALTGVYNYTDANFDIESDSLMEWIDASSGEVIAVGRTLVPSTQMLGKSVLFRVTGKNKGIPGESVPVTSTAITITTQTSSGSGKGGNYSYSGSVSGSTQAPPAPTEPVTPTPALEPSEQGFADISGYWAERYIKELSKAGIVVGKSPAQFAPDEIVTRSELLAMLFRGMQIKENAYHGDFSDVSKEDWFSGYVQEAVDRGIIATAESFRPSDAVTREEAAKIVVLCANIQPAQNTDFADNDDISPWALEYVQKAVTAGLFVGNEDGYFMPHGLLTRAQAATVVYRLSVVEEERVHE